MIIVVRPAFATLAAALLLALPAAPARADDLPDGVQGIWAIDSACDTPSKTIDIIGNTLAMGTGAPVTVTYDTRDAPNGDDAIHFTDEGDVSNFEYDVEDDLLIYHVEGYGMGRAVTYHPCADSSQSGNDPSQAGGGDNGDGNSMNEDSEGSGDQADNEAGTAPVGPAQNRCGWLTELSDGNTNLIDGDGSWILRQDGDSSVDGMDNLPDLSSIPHVSTGKGYGYACVCMQVHLGAGNVGIAEIDSMRAKPIRQCKADPHLSDPSTW